MNIRLQGDTDLGTNLELHYPSVDDIIKRLNALGPSAKSLKLISIGP